MSTNRTALTAKSRMSQTKKPCAVPGWAGSAVRGCPYIDPSGHCRDDPRRAEGVGGHVGRVAGEQGDDDAQLGIGDPLADLSDQPSDRETDRHAAGRAGQELQAGAGQREASGDDASARDPVGDQRGGVVEQALTLDARDQTARRAETAHDRRGGQRVSWRDDRVERERAGPGQLRDERVSDRAPRRRCSPAPARRR
jgi:hypothetical protein